MKTEAQIEELLRKAPTPQPASQLAATLKSAIKFSGPANGTDLELTVPFWRRWFPALAYALLILGCVVVLAVQSSQQRDLLRQNEQLRKEIAVAEVAAGEREQTLAQARRAAREIEQWKRDAAEADQLAERLARLLSQLEALNAEAGELNARLAVAPATGEIIAPYDFFGGANPALNQAREKAASIACVNNMKQIGLALRIFANDNEDWFPPNLNSVSNELSVVKVLCCPSDEANLQLAEQVGRLPDRGWSRWPLNGGSYEVFLTPRLSDAAGPDRTPGIESRVVARCRIHGHVTLGDGSVMQGTPAGGAQP